MFSVEIYASFGVIKVYVAWVYLAIFGPQIN